MDSNQLNEISAKLNNLLNHDQRKELTFLLAQETLDEEKFHIVIDKLEQWQCVDAVKLLRETWEIHHSFEYLIEILKQLNHQTIPFIDNDETDEYIIRNNGHINIDQISTQIDYKLTQYSVMPHILFPRKYLLLCIIIILLGYTLIVFFSVKTLIDGKHAKISYNQSMQVVRQLKSRLRKLEKKGTPPYPHPQWRKMATIVAGGNEKGARDDQLGSFHDFFVDEDQTVYIADSNNHRIIAWKSGSTMGEVVAGGYGQGHELYQLNSPTSVISDIDIDSLVICDRGNGRILRWPVRRSAEPLLDRSASEGQAIIRYIDCVVLAMDDVGYLYVSDLTKNEIRRYGRNDQKGTIIAGGLGKGSELVQFDGVGHLFVDSQFNLYVSDSGNHRVMKWLNGSTKGIVVAGGNGPGNDLSQLFYPAGIWVNDNGDIYIIDRFNSRIVRWDQGAKLGTLIIGENQNQSNSRQFNDPYALCFDRDGHLYVGDLENFRVQRYSVL